MRIRHLAAAILLGLAAPGAALAATFVYCVNGRIEVDMRTLRQMQSERGHSEICVIGPSFDFGPDARRWVQETLRSDVGGSCSCR